MEHIIQNKSIIFKDLGTIPYAEAWSFQEKIFEETIRIKLQNRDLLHSEQQATPNYLFICQHPPVYTLGRSGNAQHLLLQANELKNKEIEFFNTNRGGDITFHGYGQVVGYPILDLHNFFTDIHKYMRLLEQTVINTLAEYNILASRLQGATGVWLDADLPTARKICAMGVRTSRWVTMHGWALNVNTNLEYFKYIVPCGIADKAVTSMHTELKVSEVDINEVKNKLKKHFYNLLQVE